METGTFISSDFAVVKSRARQAPSLARHHQRPHPGVRGLRQRRRRRRGGNAIAAGPSTWRTGSRRTSHGQVLGRGRRPPVAAGLPQSYTITVRRRGRPAGDAVAVGSSTTASPRRSAAPTARRSGNSRSPARRARERRTACASTRAATCTWSATPSASSRRRPRRPELAAPTEADLAEGDLDHRGDRTHDYGLAIALDSAGSVGVSGVLGGQAVALRLRASDGVG